MSYIDSKFYRHERGDDDEDGDIDYLGIAEQVARDHADPFSKNFARWVHDNAPPMQGGRIVEDSAAHLMQATSSDSPHRNWWRRLSDTGWWRGLFRLNEPWLPRRDNWLQTIARWCLPDEKTKPRRSL